MIAAHVCTFRREADAPQEFGIAVVSEPGLYDAIAIIDAAGKNVEKTTLWNYALREFLGTIVLPPER